MTWWNHFGLPYAAMQALAPFAIVLAIAFGPLIHAESAYSYEMPTQADVLADGDLEVSHPATARHAASATHCGGGAVCIAALPFAATNLLMSEGGRVQYPRVNTGRLTSRVFGPLRPPNHD